MECMRDNFQDGVLLDGRFRSLSPLNSGSFGMVFMAEDVLTGEMVAVKCLTKAQESGKTATPCPAMIASDERSEELKCHTRLGAHKNIVNLLHHFETDAHMYLVLEYCSMGDLYEAIRVGRGPLQTEHVRAFMLQLVDAIDFMHAKGIYHRDIKPENIFLTHDGDVKLGDFGLATTDELSKELTVGSDRYMAPEQYDPAGGAYSPAQADIWAIGICLLNILFSRNPFVTPTERDPLFADFVRDRQSLFDVFPTMSQDTFEVLMPSLALDPERRSMKAMRDALHRVISFTTDDEALDDFCTEDRDVVVPASAHRAPLRTPSISSPAVEQGGSFPWAKALQNSPAQPVRQLSVIREPEHTASGGVTAVGSFRSNDEFFSAVGTPATTSFGASFKSLGIRSDKDLPRSEPVPITSHHPTITPAMASVFGKKATDTVSKSWSDIWDEDEEEAEAAEVTQATDISRKAFPLHLPASLPAPALLEDKENRPPSPAASTRPAGPKTANSFGRVLDAADETDLFFFEDAPSGHALFAPPPRYSPPPKYTPPSRRDIMDKWAALGDRRRNYHRSPPRVDEKRDVYPRVNSLRLDNEQGEDQEETDGDVEWVGGWHDLHL